MLFAHVWLAVLTSSLRGGRRAQTGQGLIEYALIIALIAVVAVVVVTLLGGKPGATFTNAVQLFNMPNPGS